MSKVNFNVSTAKTFRKIMNGYFLATGEIDNALCYKSDKVRALSALIRTNEDILSKDGIDPATRVIRESEIKEWKSAIEQANSEIADLKVRSENALKPARDLVSKDLYKAYCENRLHNALVLWFHANGLDGTHGEDTIKEIMSVFGRRVLKGKGRVRNNGKQIGNITRSTFTDLLLASICETMSMTYKFTYKLPEKAKKAK